MDLVDSTLVLSSLIAGLTLVVVYQQIKTFTYWSSRGIKGPQPFPFVGTNIYTFFRNRIELDEEWKNKYGRTYGVYDGSNPILRTSDRELIKFICIKHFSSFTDRNSTLVHSDEMKLWTVFASGSDWSNQRTLMAPMFSGNKMRNMFAKLISCSRKFVQEIETRQIGAAKRLAGGSEMYEMMDEVGKAKARLRASAESTSFSKDETMSLALDAIAKCFFSINLDTYKDRTSEFYKRAFAFAQFDMGWLIMWNLIPTFVSRYFKLDPLPSSKFEFFYKLTRNLINERRGPGGGRQQQHDDMLQNLIDAKIPDEHENVYTDELNDCETHYNDRMNPKELDDKHREMEQQVAKENFRNFSDLEISCITTFFFLAGFETTSSSLAFCLYEFGHQQELQEEVYQELKANLRGRDSESIDIDYADLANFKKLEAFISEALRLYNPITENTRMVTADGGILLPASPPVHLDKGCLIGITGLVCHRDEEYWDEPMKFDMSRFYPPENKLKIKNCTYHPFGVGPRNCAGMRFALLQIRLVLAYLLLKYRILPGFNSVKYPPEFNRHAFFLQLTNTDFRLIPRNLEHSTQIE